MKLDDLLDPKGPPDVPAGPPFDLWRLRTLDRQTFDALGERRLLYLAALACLAPTTHNTVPQRFRLDAASGVLQLSLDRRAILSESDPLGRQAAVSLGAVLAHLLIAAGVYGLKGKVELREDAAAEIRPAAPGEPDRVEVARVRFTPSGEAPAALAWIDAMRERKMVRAEYDERVKLSPELAARCLERVRQVHPGLTLHLLADAPTLLFLGKFQELADSTVINRPGFARELGDWLLENDSDAPVGMRGHEFGLPDEVARRFHRGLLGQGELLPDETAAFAKAGNLGMRSASAVGVITVAKDDLPHRLAAGRAFEELALLLWQHGFRVAMHAGITEVEAPNLALRGRLRTRHRPTVVFRTGQTLHSRDLSRPHASRPPLPQLVEPLV